jgi:hypothetical protein
VESEKEKKKTFTGLLLSFAVQVPSHRQQVRFLSIGISRASLASSSFAS